MATFQERRSKWRAQIRRNGHELSRTFALQADAEVWARDAERAIDRQLNPGIVRLERKDTFGGLIDLHLEDLRADGTPLGRSKDHALRQLKEALGRVKLKDLTRERLIQYGRARASGGAGPATQRESQPDTAKGRLPLALPGDASPRIVSRLPGSDKRASPRLREA